MPRLLWQRVLLRFVHIRWSSHRLAEMNNLHDQQTLWCHVLPKQSSDCESHVNLCRSSRVWTFEAQGLRDFFACSILPYLAVAPLQDCETPCSAPKSLMLRSDGPTALHQVDGGT